MKLTTARRLVQEMICEFKEDLMKQMVIIVGAPASGKSFFVENSFGPWAQKVSRNASLAKSFPILRGLHDAAGVESDNSLRRLQYKAAQEDYADLSRALTSGEFNRMLDSVKYSYKPEGEPRVWLRDFINWDDWKTHVLKEEANLTKMQKREAGAFFALTKKYYASMRGRAAGEGMKDAAREIFFDRTRHAIHRAGNVIVIDSAGEDILSTPFGKFLDMAQKQAFTTTLVQLHIPLSLSLKRNEARGKKGRAVPEAQVKRAFNNMKKKVTELRRDPRLDRYVRYEWVSTGSGIFAGYFDVAEDIRMSLQRRLGR